MAEIAVLPLATYVAGSYAIAETAIADSITSLRISVRRCTNADPTIWPSATGRVTFNLEMWDGSSWRLWNSPAWSVGGIAKDKFGNDVSVMDLAGPLPNASSRKVRGSVVLSESIRTSATITVL